MTRLDRVLARPPTWRALVFLAVTIRVMFVLAPFNVLDQIDPHALGQAVLHGDLPYRDFQFEYPPGAVFSMILAGAVPAGLSDQALALQAIACEVVVWTVLGDALARRRYVLVATLAFPLLAGGFDGVPMACMAVSTAWLIRGDQRGWWFAGLGATVKLIPGIAWGWMRRWGRTGTAVLALTVVVLLVPLGLGEGRDVYLRYHADRGVQQEAVPASATYVVRRVVGDPVDVVFRFRANELVGAETAAAIALVAFGAAAVALAVRVRVVAQPPEPWITAFAMLLLVLCASKVLSPQYMVLLTPFAARLGGAWCVAVLGAVALSLVAFLDDTKGTTFMSVIAARNVLLVGMAVAAGCHALRPAPET